jgi:drug/metabolite transporter (DMT)-like permease
LKRILVKQMGKINYSSSFWSLQVSVMLFGGASIFGALLPINPFLLVWGRTAWAVLFLILLILISKEKINFTKKENYLNALLLGIILAIHWTSFFQSIQMANVAVAVLTFSSFPLFTMLLSPIYSFGKIERKNLISSVLIIAGIVVMVPLNNWEIKYLYGIFWGLISAFSFALLILTNKKISSGLGPFEQAFWQNAAVSLLLMPCLFFYEINLNLREHFYWMLLGTVFTGLSHGLYVYGLKGTDAQKASLYAALEPVYAILWALIFLGQVPGLREVLGGLIILFAVRIGTKN